MYCLSTEKLIISLTFEFEVVHSYFMHGEKLYKCKAKCTF